MCSGEWSWLSVEWCWWPGSLCFSSSPGVQKSRMYRCMFTTLPLGTPASRTGILARSGSGSKVVPVGVSGSQMCRCCHGDGAVGCTERQMIPFSITKAYLRAARQENIQCRVDFWKDTD